MTISHFLGCYWEGNSYPDNSYLSNKSDKIYMDDKVLADNVGKRCLEGEITVG